jgi:hypothetical protein
MPKRPTGVGIHDLEAAGALADAAQARPHSHVVVGGVDGERLSIGHAATISYRARVDPVVVEGWTRSSAARLAQ